MKKTISLILVLCLVSAIGCPAFATDPSSNVPTDFGEPVSEETYFDENLGIFVTERSYFIPDNPGISAHADSGSGWFKNTRTFQWSSGVTTSYALGYFTWGNGDVSVSNPYGGYDWHPSDAKFHSQNTKTGTGRFAGIFNKYAYVTYNLYITNAINLTQDLSVTVRVSESGNQS